MSAYTRQQPGETLDTVDAIANMYDKLIVVAWVEETSRFDNQTREHVADRKPFACVWLRRGTDSDAVKAQAHMDLEQPETGRIFTFPLNEREPLKRARKEVLT